MTTPSNWEWTSGWKKPHIKLSVLSADWEKGLEILKEVLTRPRFDAKVIEVAKEQEVAAPQAARAKTPKTWPCGRA